MSREIVLRRTFIVLSEIDQNKSIAKEMNISNIDNEDDNPYLLDLSRELRFLPVSDVKIEL